MKYLNITAILLCLFVINTPAQDQNVRLGAQRRGNQSLGGLFDYSDPNSVNIKVNIWGYCRYPGSYMVPINTSLADLISLAGGPTPDALVEKVRLVRTLADSTQQITNYDYNQYLWEEKVNQPFADTILQPGDMVVMPGEPRFFFRDYFSMTLSIVSTLISLSILVLNIVRN